MIIYCRYSDIFVFRVLNPFTKSKRFQKQHIVRPHRLLHHKYLKLSCVWDLSDASREREVVFRGRVSNLSVFPLCNYSDWSAKLDGLSSLNKILTLKTPFCGIVRKKR